MKTPIPMRPTDYKGIEHISTILQRYLDFVGLSAKESTRTPEPKVTRFSQLELADNFENLVDLPREPALADSQSRAIDFSFHL